MSRNAVILLSVGLALGSSATSRASAFAPPERGVRYGETSLAQVEGPGSQARPAQPTRPAPSAAPAAPATLLPAAQLVNVQIEFTISDQMGTAAPDKKTVSMIAADGTWGRIRASARAQPGPRLVGVSLKVDARPRMISNDRVQMELTIEYQPLSTITGEKSSQVEPTTLNQSLSVILQNGKAMIVSQAADPVSDRKILIEAKATVLK